VNQTLWPSIRREAPLRSFALGWRRVFPRARLDIVTLVTAYLAALLFIPSSLIFSPLGGAGTPATVLSLLILLWYAASWLTGKVVPSGAGRPIRLAILAFSLAVLASFVAAMTREIAAPEALSAGRGLITVLSWSGLVVVLSQGLSRYEQLDIIMRRAVVFGSVVALIEIFEFYTGINVTNYLHIPGLTLNIDFSTLQTRGTFYRPSSTATDPIEFSVAMVILLPFALHQALDPARSGRIRKWLPVALIGFAILASVSRSGIIGAVIVLLFLVPTWTPRQRRGFLVALLPGLAVVKVAAHGLLGTLSAYFTDLFHVAGEGSVYSTRVAAWSLDWPYISARPVFGRGWATLLAATYSWTDDMYLAILVETGVVGLICLILLYLTGIQCGAAGRRKTQDPRRRHFGQALVAAIAAAAVTSATFDSISFPMVAGLTFLVLGIAGAYDGIMAAEEYASALLADSGRPLVPSRE
jgi:polysaccharide biosynthesis protein PslJ